MKHLADQTLRHQRRGTTVFEMVAALGLLSGLLAVTLPFLSKLTNARQDVVNREVALLEVRNLAEQARSGIPLSDLKLSESTSKFLDQPQLSIAPVEDNEEPLLHVQIRLSWINQAQQRISPIELSTWVSGEDEQ